MEINLIKYFLDNLVDRKIKNFSFQKKNTYR
jgi:hypothetical protein